MKTLLSVIIPTKNEAINIKSCLKSIKNQSYQNIEIIVVDNFSSDQTIKTTESLGAAVFKKGPERSQQRNFGARKAKGRYLLFLDADMTMETNVVKQAIGIFTNNPHTKALVVPEITRGKNYWARVRGLERACYLNQPDIEAARIFEKETFLKAGGFDETLIAAEDWDLTNRIKNLGQIGRTDSQIVHHEGKLSLIGHLKKKYYYSQNINLYAQKYPERFKSQSGIKRAQVFLNHWRLLKTQPCLSTGIVILKLLEYLVYLAAKISIKQNAKT